MSKIVKLKITSAGAESRAAFDYQLFCVCVCAHDVYATFFNNCHITYTQSVVVSHIDDKKIYTHLTLVK